MIRVCTSQVSLCSAAWLYKSHLIGHSLSWGHSALYLSPLSSSPSLVPSSLVSSLLLVAVRLQRQRVASWVFWLRVSKRLLETSSQPACLAFLSFVPFFRCFELGLDWISSGLFMHCVGWQRPRLIGRRKVSCNWCLFTYNEN